MNSSNSYEALKKENAELRKESAAQKAEIEDLRFDNYRLKECGPLSARMLNRLPAAYCLSGVEGFGAGQYLVRGAYNEGLRRLLGYDAPEFEGMKEDFYKKVIHTDDHHLIGDALEWFEQNPSSKPFLAACRLMTSEGREVPSLIINSQLSKHTDGRSREMLSVGIPLTGVLHKYELLEDWIKLQKQQLHADVVNKLTQRQKEVLKLRVNGVTEKEIAVILKKSVKTIKKHGHEINRRLGVHNLLKIIKLAVCCGLN
jgi:DNA-binding CsgD family transcriptional regulator